MDTAVDTVNQGSLRWAIGQANQTAGLDEILFNIGFQGVQQTIILDANLGTLLPITEEVLIDGWSQGGVFGGVWVEISGSNLAGATGLEVNTSGCNIFGLAISDFAVGIALNNTQAAGNSVYSCYIGAGLTGEAANAGNTQGILIRRFR